MLLTWTSGNIGSVCLPIFLWNDSSFGRHVKFKENVSVFVSALGVDKLLFGSVMCHALVSAFAVCASIPSFGVRGYMLVSCNLSFHHDRTSLYRRKGNRHVSPYQVIQGFRNVGS